MSRQRTYERELLDLWYKSRNIDPSRPEIRHKPSDKTLIHAWREQNDRWVAYCEEVRELRNSYRRDHLNRVTYFLTGAEPSNRGSKSNYREWLEWHSKMQALYITLWNGKPRRPNQWFEHITRHRAWCRLQEKLYGIKERLHCDSSNTKA